MTTLFGILLGLGAALSQCFAYLISRAFVVQHRHAFVQFLLTSHLYMGVMALLVLAAAWPAGMPLPRQAMVPLAGTTLFYIIGQAAMLLLMRFINPSRVAPLLGAKILVLAVLATAFFGYRLSGPQILAVIACAAAVLLLNATGGGLSIRAGAVLLVACTGYSLCDLYIQALIISLRPLPPLHAAMLAGALSYVLSGLLSLAILPWLIRRRHLVSWRYALPFSLLWYGAMLGLFGCIGYVGPVFGVILQSSRGLMALAIGVVVARLGWLHIETRLSRPVLVKRAVAALLMSLAIGLYAATAG